MSISPGRNLLHYRLIEKIGEGGMGVVWKALDTTLDREVAIKILPDQFAAEADRLARFEREARVLASLNHAHIAGIFGIHEAEGKRFLAIELVPGEDLSALLERGPLPQGRIFKIAREIAEALEAAHENGVVHRDLKPANVRLTHDGAAKVLDFGLAKAYDPATASDPMRSATVTSAGTVAGLILGTAAYMSPEQASGQPTDRRADIWSFGVLLYEMLSGKRFFAGETISHTLADVLRKPIDLDDLPDSTPPRLRRLIERCLERDPRRRLRDIGEARIVLEDAIADPGGQEAHGPASTEAPTPRRPWPWVVAGAAIVIAVAALVFGGGTSEPQPTRRFSLDVPNSGAARQGDGRTVAMAPDGTYVVTRGGAGAEDMIFRRDLNNFTTKPVDGTIGGRTPFFSPDGRWIGFTKALQLYKVRATGGPPTLVGTVQASPNGYSWGYDGFIYFGAQGRLWRIPADGGEAEALTERPGGDQRLGYPFALPGGRALLCASGVSPRTGQRLLLFDIESKQLRDLEMSGSDPRYLTSGHVLFAQGSDVYIAPFDLGRLEISGTATPVLPRVWVDQAEMQLDVSADGTVAYLPTSDETRQITVRADLDGQIQPLLPEALPFHNINDPRLSRDGRKLALASEGSAIWLVDMDTQTPTLMSEEGFYPHWSPDDTRLAYGSTRGDSFDIYVRKVDLSGPEELLLDVENNLRLGDWTLQGTLIIREEIPDKGMDLSTADLERPELVPLLKGDDDELAPTVSRDGKWLAFVSNYSGTDEVYVTTFPTPGARKQISVRGGSSPCWAPDGSAIYYFENKSLIEVTIEAEPRFQVTGRKALFEGDYVQYRWSRQYDIAPDGSYFVLVQNPPRGNIEVVTNWFAEIEEND